MKLTFSEAKMDGGWLCLKVNELAPARGFVLAKQSRLYDCEIKEHREKRSLDANAYCWVLLDKLAQATRIPKTEIYRKAIKEIGGVSDTVCVQQKAADRLCYSWECNGFRLVFGTLREPFKGLCERHTVLRLQRVRHSSDVPPD